VSKYNKERDYFIRILDHKIKAEAQLSDGHTVTMLEIAGLFSDLNYQLTGQQLNHLYLNTFNAGRNFSQNNLREWIKLNYQNLKPKVADFGRAAQNMHVKLLNL
jgi:hypothetical protein